MKSRSPFLVLLGVAALLLSNAVRAWATVGATTPFVSMEAEDGQLGGGAVVHTFTGLQPHQRSSPECESSGRAYVELNATGQSVTWKNTTTQSFTAINIRFSIPDAPQGGGTTSTLNLYVDGKFRQSVPLSSAQCWLYHNNGTKDPSAGSPYHFWDETHLFITGAPVAPGSSLTLQQDAANNAAFYWLDVIDLETPPAPLAQPADSLSITDFGAVPNDKNTDDTASIQHCFDAAHDQGKAAWIPPGTFYLNTSKGLNAKKITIQGAGMWYSLIYRNVPLPSAPGGRPDMIDPVSCTIKDIALDQNAPARDGPYGDGGGINIKGSDWLIDSVWVQHTSSGVWGDGFRGTVQNCRMLSTWGDGINLNNGNSGNDGEDLTARNNFVRGTGDDCLAINSDKTSHLMQRITFINNTSVAPWEANNLGIYGGHDILVKDNLLSDASTECGLSVGVFGNGGSAIESGTVVGNVINRAGDHGHGALGIGTDNEINSIANVYVGNNTIKDPITRGIAIRKGVNIVIENNHVDGGGKPGFLMESWAAGSGIFNGNTATNISSGDPSQLQSTAKYAVVQPTMAASFKNSAGHPVIETCSEGGQNISGLNNGDVTLYPGLNLDGTTTFTARVASGGAGGTLSVFLDKDTGTPIGTCTVTSTGGNQSWADVSCTLPTANTGSHDVYLVFNGTGTNLFSVKWFAFTP